MSTHPASKAPLAVRARTWLGNNIVKLFAVIAFIYLLLPVVYTFVFSFNDAGRTNIVWQGFTLNNWKNPCGAPQVCESVVNSIVLARGVTVVSTILGAMIAFALVRYQFRGRGTTNLTIFLPMATPEVVLGSSLLALFLNIFVPLGFWTVFIANVMFCISFVVVTVKARLASLDPRLEQAAMDLYDEYKAPVDPAKQLEIGKEIIQKSTEGLFAIGTVGMSPGLVVVKNNFHNVVPEHTSDWLVFTPGTQNTFMFWMEQE